MIKISEELLNDSVFNMPAYISKEFARRIGAAEEEAFFTGNGTGKPLGILASSGGAEVGVTAASATAVTFEEIIDLFYSLRGPYRQDAVFIMNDATIKNLRKLKNGLQTPVKRGLHMAAFHRTRYARPHPEPSRLHYPVYANSGSWRKDHPVR